MIQRIGERRRDEEVACFNMMGYEIVRKGQTIGKVAAAVRHGSGTIFRRSRANN